MDNNETFSNTLDILIANTNTIEVLTIIIVVASIIGIMIYVAVQQSAKDGNCNSLKTLYTNESNVKPFTLSKQFTYTISGTEYDTRLRDVYVKSSYNSCSAGNYKDDWVSTCALNEVLKQGCRCLDFEIYSVNHKPVVATSTTTDYFTKETWNSISFENVTKIIKNNAFSGDYVPNSTDPLLIHLRFKSNDILMYNNLAKIVQSDLDSYTLDNKYTCGYVGEGKAPANVLDATFKSGVLTNKVIFIVDGNANNTYVDSSFNEYVNLSSSCGDTPSVTEYRTFSAENIETDDTLTKLTKAGEVIVLPDLNAKPKNMDCTSKSKGLFRSGCQIVGMCFQLNDTYLTNYIKFFDAPENGEGTPCAFRLKDLSLINPATSETYTMPPEMESGTSTITTAYGSFDYPTYTKKTT
jgi:hypothetical protein